MNSMLEIPEIEKEYTLFALAPTRYYDRMVDLARVWIMGFENTFERMFEQPNEDYLNTYAETDDEWFYIYLHKEGAENHPNYGDVFDLRLYKDMVKMRRILEAAE